MGETFKADLVSLINKKLSLDPDIAVEPATDLAETGLVDSLGVVEIVHWMEEELDVEIDPGDVVLENFRTVDLMCDFAGRLVGAS